MDDNRARIRDKITSWVIWLIQYNTFPDSKMIVSWLALEIWRGPTVFDLSNFQKARLLLLACYLLGV